MRTNHKFPIGFALMMAAAGFPVATSALPLLAPPGFVAQDDGRLWQADAKRDRNNQQVPGVILSGPTWRSLAGNHDSAYGVTTEGTLWTLDSNPPAQTGTQSDWTSVSAGGDRYFAIKSNGALWAAGSGYLGHPSISYSTALIQIGADGAWESVAAGGSHNLAIRQDGSLWAWGHNSHGQLGLGDTLNRSTPVRVGGENSWAMAAAGGNFSLAIKDDGSLWSWGLNSSGSLGQGLPSYPYTAISAPARVGTDNDWKSIVGGSDFAIAIKQDGSLWSWGGNNDGQLGLGDTTDRISPQGVGDSIGWHLAIAEGTDVLAARQDGTLWSWGITRQSNQPVEITHLYTPAPYIAVLDGIHTLRSGRDLLDFETVIQGEPKIRTLTIRNDGILPLTITGCSAPAGFSATLPAAPIQPGQTAGLTVHIDALIAGTSQGSFGIQNNDPSLPLFNVNLTGIVVSAAQDTDGDGLNDAAEVALAPLGFHWQYSDPARVAELISKAPLLQLYPQEQIEEIQAQPALSAPPAAGTPWEVGLGFQYRRDLTPVPLAPGDIQTTPDGKLKLSIPASGGRRFIHLISQP